MHTSSTVLFNFNVCFSVLNASSLGAEKKSWHLQNGRAPAILTQQRLLLGLCVWIMGFAELHTEYFNEMHSWSVNYAILQVKLGHCSKLWQIAVDKDSSVFWKARKNAPVEWWEILPNRIFCFLNIKCKYLQVENLIALLAWKVTVQKYPVWWFYFEEKHTFKCSIDLVLSDLSCYHN